MKGLASSLILILMTYTLSSQTIIPGGYVSGTWQASQSPFHIQGNIEIHFDSTLIIEPGVDVYFDGSYKLTVHGRLNASGNETDSILLTGENPEIGWKGIDFYQINEMLDSSSLRFCNIEWTKEYYYMEDAAINIYQSDKIAITHSCIRNNRGYYCGGIYIKEAKIKISHSIIENNCSSDGGAGGIYCVRSIPVFNDLKIFNNESPVCGGLYCYNCPVGSISWIKNVEISKNKGGQVGGLEIRNSSNVRLENCKISYNNGDICGGIGFFENSSLVSPVTGKNQIYFNKGGKSHELFCNDFQTIEISVDTFTVWDPDEYHVFPSIQFQFIEEIEFGFIEPVDHDLFISTSGNDSNDGLYPENALRSFNHALRRIKCDLLHPHTLWILPGIYHLNESDSGSAIYLKEYACIAAADYNQVIIDGDSITRLITSWNKKHLNLIRLTLQNGFSQYNGGAIFLNSSHATIDSCNIISNNSYEGGGAFIVNTASNVIFNFCKFLYNTSVLDGGGIYVRDIGSDGVVELNYCDFVGNSSGHWGGGLSNIYSKIILKNCTFITNQALVYGGGAHIVSPNAPQIINCNFLHNNAGDNGGGLAISDFQNHDFVYGYMTNCTFSDNTAESGTAISLSEFNELKISNSIFWNAIIPNEHLISLHDWYYTDSTTTDIDHSLIQGGEASVFLQGSRTRLGWGDGNISINPEFNDPSNSNYSLNWDSPCIEAGREDKFSHGLLIVDRYFFRS